jgi:cytochrome c-type biogenesis protein CcmH/NrfG
MAAKTNQPNREELLDMAENAARKGQKDGARVMFRQVLNQDKRNERAMMWLARLAKTQDERRQWLQRVLTVNPNNDAARAALEKIQYAQRASDNRTLVTFGVVAVALIAVTALIFIVLSALAR